MADEKAPPTASRVTMGDIKELVKSTIAEMMPKDEGKTSSVATGDDKTPSVGIAAMVQAEIDKIKAKETEDAEKATIQEKLNELSEKTQEKQPVERRRVHKFMGWGENDK